MDKQWRCEGGVVFVKFYLNGCLGDLKYVAGSWDIVRTHRPAGVKGHRNEVQTA